MQKPPALPPAGILTWRVRGPVCVLISALWIVSAGQKLAAQAESEAPRIPSRAATEETYHYRMKGSVRLLLFWVGKDDVGGGHIAFSTMPDPGGHASLVASEVVFGSNPKRVPGKINRWGYGVEVARRGFTEKGDSSCLQASVFEGFIRHSSEESLSQVRQADNTEKSRNQFWYDAIVSRVFPEEASAEIWKFVMNSDFDYSNLSPVQSAYALRRQEKPADRQQVLDVQGRTYSEPLGFLTAVRELMHKVSAEARPDAAAGKHRRGYAYNAQGYYLTIVKLRPVRPADLHAATTGSAVLDADSLNSIVAAEFEIMKHGSRQPRRFALWFARRGNLREVPLKIIDKPRWWLQVELNLLRVEQKEAPWTDHRMALASLLNAGKPEACPEIAAN